MITLRVSGCGFFVVAWTVRVFQQSMAIGYVVAAAAVTLPIAAQFFFAAQGDQSALEREQTVVQNGLESRIGEISRLAVPQAVWDDAVVNLDNALSLDWAHENIGAFLSSTNGFEAALVLDRADEVTYAMRNGETVPKGTVGELRSAAADLVEGVRHDERERGPVADLVARGETLSKPVLRTAVTRVGNQAFVLTATLVQPDFGTALPSSSRSAVVITAEAIDEAFLKTMSERYLLEGLALHLGDTPVSNRQATAHLYNGQGQVVGTLHWLPPTPGTTLLHRALPPMLLMVLALAGLALLLYLHQRRAAQNLIASEKRSAHLAYHDTLTGLPNRALLAGRLSASLEMLRRSGRSFAVHCLDLDRFKDVNDTFGHEAGDELIRAVAQRLVSTCREFDTVARLGGDEFAIIQLDASPETAAAFAERLIQTLSAPVDLPIGRLHVGCSVGVTLVAGVGASPQECLRQADLALYKAKDNGRSQFTFFESEMDAALRMRRGLQDDLRDTLARDGLHLAYQPQVDGRGQIIGIEALARWDHPTRGAIAPSTFVPIAEECGLIDALGMFTLRRAFEDSAAWPDLRVAINVSAPQLRLRNFAERLEALVEEVGITPSRFELEITEGLLLGDDPQTHATLQRIRDMGFSVALDDFGTGYSSLSYLQRYPIDKIKIDRSFIANLGADTEAEAVVSAIVRLAGALGLSVIAEGVETDLQRKRLLSAGCRNMQGYLFGGPISAEDLIVTLAGCPQVELAS